MSEPMTMDQARRLSTQDCPLPSLAGPALRLLVEHVDRLENAARAAADALEMAGDEHGVAGCLRVVLGEKPAIIGIDHGTDDRTAVCVGEKDAQNRLHIRHMVQWPRRADLTHAQLVALSAALQLYPFRNTHQLQARKVCQGVSKLAAELMSNGFTPPSAKKPRCPDFPNCPNLGCPCGDQVDG